MTNNSNETRTMRYPKHPMLVSFKTWSAGICLLAGLVSTSFANTELAGVRYVPALKSGASSLVLNGSGISYKAVTKQYTVGLYVPKTSSSAKDLINMAGPKQLRYVMLVPMRVDTLGALLAKGIELNSTREEFRRLIPSTIEMGQVFAKIQRMYPGDTVAIDYNPERGTQFLVNDRPVGNAIAGAGFFNAVLKSWIGDKPTAQDLKNDLLKVKATVAMDVLDE
jgi:Chalcone isomerase-like